MEEAKVPSSRKAPKKWPDNITSNVCELQSSRGVTIKEVEVPSSKEAAKEWLDNISKLNIKKGPWTTNIKSTIEDCEN